MELWQCLVLTSLNKGEFCRLAFVTVFIINTGLVREFAGTGTVTGERDGDDVDERGRPQAYCALLTC